MMKITNFTRLLIVLIFASCCEASWRISTAPKVDGSWGEWERQDAPLCAGPCGSRTLRFVTFIRKCNNPPPSNYGKECEGQRKQLRSEYCWVVICPVHGGWSSWMTKHNGECSVTCGGEGVREVTKYRSCDTPRPRHGGNPCRGRKDKTVAEKCFTSKECPGHGGWGSWDKIDHTDCSVSCGNGTARTRYMRYCDNPPPSPTGRLCAGEDTKTVYENCFSPCPEHSSKSFDTDYNLILIIIAAAIAVLSCITGMLIFKRRKRKGPLLDGNNQSVSQQDTENPGLTTSSEKV